MNSIADYYIDNEILGKNTEKFIFSNNKNDI